ncbi:type VI immunity family protein [Rubellimicrobium arenae]|uniref:type VI immunity family protein n=1 Tax=Rubellimicrobium arenae TaxID=2817372 RepID=UPI001B30D4D0|nr:type VI immunity family protein [Rubellimicrobium arenae]
MIVSPINTPLPDRDGPGLLVELKTHLVVFLGEPPGPRTAKRVFDLYESVFGDSFGIYKATLDYAFLKAWTPEAKAYHDRVQRPDLRRGDVWGYGFQEAAERDARLFMHHGYRPYTEPDHASFCRFEFEADLPPGQLLRFAELLLPQLPVLSAYGGFFFQGRPNDRYDAASADRIFALSRRFWGPEVVDVELTASVMKRGYKCVNWLTAIGPVATAELRLALGRARDAAEGSTDLGTCVLLRAGEAPILGDRNRFEDLSAYRRIAAALLPLQVARHPTFRGSKWDPATTLDWLRRFTLPEGL